VRVAAGNNLAKERKKGPTTFSQSLASLIKTREKILNEESVTLWPGTKELMPRRREVGRRLKPSRHPREPESATKGALVFLGGERK